MLRLKPHAVLLTHKILNLLAVILAFVLTLKKTWFQLHNRVAHRSVSGTTYSELLLRDGESFLAPSAHI